MAKTKPKTDPLAKVSVPNLRRMVKRRDAEIARLTKELDEANAAYNRRADDWAKMSKVAMDMQSDRDHHALMSAKLMVERDRLAAELAAIKQADPLDPNDHPHPCGALDGERYALTRQEPPDGRVVVNVAAVTEPGHWHRIVREGGEYIGTTITLDNTPAEVQVPPFGAGMPGMTLGVPALNTSPWWRLAFWLRSDTPLTCPAVADSPEGRAAIVCDEYDDNRKPSPLRSDRHRYNMCVSRVCGSDGSLYPIPPATWRAA